MNGEKLAGQFAGVVCGIGVQEGPIRWHKPIIMKLEVT